MTKTIHGRIHGKTIELDEDVGIGNGQEFEVTVRPVKPRRPWGQGIKSSAGVLAEEDDRILEEIQKDWK